MSAINPKADSYNKLSKITSSIIRDAFKQYKKGQINSVYIIADTQNSAEIIIRAKDEIENRVHYVGTDAGFYDTPALGDALHFSLDNVKVLPKKCAVFD